MTFSLQAASDAEITECYLFFRATNEGQTNSVDVKLVSSTDIDVSYTRNLRASPLPPFAPITYWWLIRDKAGEELSTEQQVVNYVDNRFEWNTVSSGGTSVHWIKGSGNPGFGQAALDIVSTSIPRINVELETTIPETVDLYIYDSKEHLNFATEGSDREWIIGQAIPETGVIVILIPAREGYRAQMMRDIPHELTHLLLFQAVSPEGYRYVPEWLDEGLAISNEQLPDPELAITLETARSSGRMIPLADLCVPSPPDRAAATLAYAESGSVVQFIRAQYGAAGIRSLVSSYAHGASCSAGIQQALGLSLGTLEINWRVSLAPGDKWKVWLRHSSFFLAVTGLSLFLAIPLIGMSRKRP